MDTNYIQDYFLSRNISALYNHYQLQRQQNSYDLAPFSYYLDKHYYFLKFMADQLVKKLNFFNEKYGFFIDVIEINNKLYSHSFVIEQYLYHSFSQEGIANITNSFAIE